MMYEPKEVGLDDANIVSGCQWCVVKDQRIAELEATNAALVECLHNSIGINAVWDTIRHKLLDGAALAKAKEENT